MKRRRGFGSSELDGGSSSDSFAVEARTGHAWFARQDAAPHQERPRNVVERRATTLPALRHAELVLAGQTRTIARRPVRIPADSIVSVSAPSLRQTQTRLSEGPASRGGANDNILSRGGSIPLWAREVLFLLIFVVTLAATYFVGRMHAAENVIVVPDIARGATRIS